MNEEKNRSLPPLSTELVQTLWSQTYNKHGKPDWSHLFPYYRDDIVFEDTIQTIKGKAEFMEMCGRLTRRCQQINMDIHDIARVGDTIYFDWEMRMIFRRFPSTPVFGATRLTLDQNGLILHQRDYYDLWGDIINGIPGFRRLYRWFMHQYFG